MSTAEATRVINIVLAMGPTSPSPRQVHNILGREGRDPLWLFSNPLLFFSLLAHRVQWQKITVQHTTCAPHLGYCCIFYVANKQAEHQVQKLVNNGDRFVTNQAAAASVSILWGFSQETGCCVALCADYSDL